MRGIREIQIFFFFATCLFCHLRKYHFPWHDTERCGWGRGIRRSRWQLFPGHFQSWPLQELVGLLASLSSVSWKHNHCSFLLFHICHENKLPEYSASWYSSLSCFLDSVVSCSSFPHQVHMWRQANHLITGGPRAEDRSKLHHNVLYLCFPWEKVKYRAMHYLHSSVIIINCMFAPNLAHNRSLKGYWRSISHSVWLQKTYIFIREIR